MGALGVRCCHSLEFGQDRHFVRVRRFIRVDPATRGEVLRRWMMRPKDASFCKATSLQLEQTGFEASVPLTAGLSKAPTKRAAVPTNSTLADAAVGRCLIQSKFPAKWNREIIVPTQGIKSADQGSFSPDQGRGARWRHEAMDKSIRCPAKDRPPVQVLAPQHGVIGYGEPAPEATRPGNAVRKPLARDAVRAQAFLAAAAAVCFSFGVPRRQCRNPA